MSLFKLGGENREKQAVPIYLKVVKKLKPVKIIPIHTFHPDKYSGLFNRKIEQVSDGEVFVV